MSTASKSGDRKSGKGTSARSGSKRRLFDDSNDEKAAVVVDLTGTPAKEATANKKKAKSSLHQAPFSFSSATAGSASAAATSTPVKKRAKTSSTAIVTPGDAVEDDTNRTDNKKAFVPKYIHKNLDYCTQGRKNLPETTVRAFELVCGTHEIPEDLESSRVHGPLSGGSFEELVLRHYSLELLDPKPEYSNDDEATKICVSCAKQGHKRDDCPTLL